VKHKLTRLGQSLDLFGDEESSAAIDEYLKHSTPGVTTVVVPPAPKHQELSAAALKKKRDREYQRNKRATARSTGTISDDDVVSTVSSGRRPTKRARLADDD
jgi:chromatin modification-related protein EAF6